MHNLAILFWYWPTIIFKDRYIMNYKKINKNKTWISFRISLKSKNFLPGRCRNSPHSSSVPSPLLFRCTNCSTSGRRVQISLPRGRKSRPTNASNTLDLPLLWLPTTATCGSSIVDWLPSCEKMSCNLFTIGMTECPSGAEVPVALLAAPEDCSSAMESADSGDWKAKNRVTNSVNYLNFGTKIWCWRSRECLAENPR